MSYGLPYYQLASKWMTTDAPFVAALLRVGDAPVSLREIDRMIGIGARLFAYAVDATWSDEKPPDGVFVGPVAEVADLLEAAVQWDGARGALVAAFIRAEVIERLEMGLRVRGCDRYRQTWEKNRRRKNRTGSKPAGSGPVPSGSSAKPGGTVRETETETETEESQRQHLAGASGDPPGKRRVKASDKPADPRIRELSDRLVATYRDVTGREYLFQGAKDGSALPRLVALLSPTVTVDALAQRFAAGLRSRFGTLTGIADFASRPSDPRWGGAVPAYRDAIRADPDQGVPLRPPVVRAECEACCAEDERVETWEHGLCPRCSHQAITDVHAASESGKYGEPEIAAWIQRERTKRGAA